VLLREAKGLAETKMGDDIRGEVLRAACHVELDRAGGARGPVIPDIGDPLLDTLIYDGLQTVNIISRILRFSSQLWT
jgi:hypothetical protein